MDVAEITPIQAGQPTTIYIAQNIAAARQLLAQARDLLGVTPEPGLAPLPPNERARAIDMARNAAEHLYDAGQVDEPHEAVREALVAAQAIMDTIQHLEHPNPAAVDATHAAQQRFLDIDGTLTWVQHCLETTNH